MYDDIPLGGAAGSCSATEDRRSALAHKKKELLRRRHEREMAELQDQLELEALENNMACDGESYIAESTAPLLTNQFAIQCMDRYLR